MVNERCRLRIPMALLKQEKAFGLALRTLSARPWHLRTSEQRGPIDARYVTTRMCSSFLQNNNIHAAVPRQDCGTHTRNPEHSHPQVSCVLGARARQRVIVHSHHASFRSHEFVWQKATQEAAQDNQTRSRHAMLWNEPSTHS